MYIPYGGLKAIHDERVEHFLHRSELRRLVNEAIADARAQDQAHSRRRRTPGLATIIRQARAVIFGISI